MHLKGHGKLLTIYLDDSDHPAQDVDIITYRHRDS